MPNPTRCPNGFNDNEPTAYPRCLMPTYDPTKHIRYFNDFFSYNASDWTITTTELGAGSATEALVNGQGGALLITNDAADDGDSILDCVVIKDSTATESAVSSLLTDATYSVFEFFYNGVDAVEFYVDNDRIASLAVTNLPDDEDLTVSFGIQNGEAVAKTMTIDYIDVLQER